MRGFLLQAMYVRDIEQIWLTMKVHNARMSTLNISMSLLSQEETPNTRDVRAFDSLVGGGLGRDLSHTIRKLPLSQRSRMDTLTG